MKMVTWMGLFLGALISLVPSYAAAHHHDCRRSLWVYSIGNWREVGGGQWIETNTAGIPYYYSELARNEEFVELKDYNRNILVRLYDTYEAAKPDSPVNPFQVGYYGQWQCYGR